MEEKALTTENEAMDGESLARSEAESPKGCEQDANNKRRKRLKRKDGKERKEKTLTTEKAEKTEKRKT